jgi:hypothetical protein
MPWPSSVMISASLDKFKRILVEPADNELSISSERASVMLTPTLREFLKRPGMSMLCVAINDVLLLVDTLFKDRNDRLSNQFFFKRMHFGDDIG